MKKVLVIALLSGVVASPAWALFETNKDLIATAKITMEEAVEAELGKEDGRTVYEVQIIEANKKMQKVYVDAQTGQAKIDK
ncbi:MAG: PepSY domain-containing protein [Nitrospira sp.]|nr:PepSY domain-containing protein [Nitrospira sp.]